MSHDPDQHASLGGMYSDYFLDYASYVILERAVPHLADGLKPVQRRILHSMREIDDGRYHKVANIVGNTMKFHPHGDQAIADALVQLGQKDLLVDCQGNWGNTLTGDGAAAPRYIEARLTKFALEVAFNPKTTGWTPSYDGRNKEPVTLPMKFPLLLAQGVEGIAVGLACKILPHNFHELIDAAIAAGGDLAGAHCLRVLSYVVREDLDAAQAALKAARRTPGCAPSAQIRISIASACMHLAQGRRRDAMIDALEALSAARSQQDGPGEAASLKMVSATCLAAGLQNDAVRLAHVAEAVAS